MRFSPIRSLPAFLALSDLLAAFVLAYSCGALCRRVPSLDGRVITRSTRETRGVSM